MQSQKRLNQGKNKAIRGVAWRGVAWRGVAWRGDKMTTEDPPAIICGRVKL